MNRFPQSNCSAEMLANLPFEERKQSRNVRLNNSGGDKSSEAEELMFSVRLMEEGDSSGFMYMSR